MPTLTLFSSQVGFPCASFMSCFLGEASTTPLDRGSLFVDDPAGHTGNSALVGLSADFPEPVSAEPGFALTVCPLCWGWPVQDHLGRVFLPSANSASTYCDSIVRHSLCLSNTTSGNFPNGLLSQCSLEIIIRLLHNGQE